MFYDFWPYINVFSPFFIFAYGVKKYSNFILLHVAVQFSQHHLLKTLVFSPLCILASFVVLSDDVSVGLSGLYILFY